MTFLETWKITSVRKIKAAILDDSWEIMITKVCVNNHANVAIKYHCTKIEEKFVVNY